jgi:hypothetical protein
VKLFAGLSGTVGDARPYKRVVEGADPYQTPKIYTK